MKMKELIESKILAESRGNNKASVMLDGHGTYIAGPRSLAKAERMDKRKVAEKIADSYDGFEEFTSKGYGELSYWMKMPKAIIDIVYADIYEGGA